MLTSVHSEHRPPDQPPRPASRTGRARWGGALLGAAVVLALAFWGDAPVDAWVRAHRQSPWLPLAWWVTHWSDWPELLLLVGAFYGLAVWRRRVRWRQLAAAMAVGLLVVGGSSTLIRSVTGRTRPNATAVPGWYGVRHDGRWLIGRSDFNAFPSGHMGAMMGVVMPLILGTRRGRLPGVLAAILMAWARVFTWYHHLSDVVASAILGVVLGTWLWRRWGWGAKATPRE